MRDNCRVHVDADDAVTVYGPGGPMGRAGAAGTGHCGCWLEKIHLGSWTRCGADRGADLDLWVHTR